MWKRSLGLLVLAWRWSGRQAAELADELWIVAGTAAMAAGFWWIWPPGAYFAVGAVILWLALPARGPFVVRRPDPETKVRRKSE